MSADARFSTATGTGSYTVDRPAAGRSGAIVGALAAAAASVGLAWWLGADEGGPVLSSSSAPAVIAAAPRPFATPVVEESQVRRAYEQFQALYAEAGMDSLLQSSQTCSAALGDDPRILDFCLALDMYASTLPRRTAAQEAWFKTAGERRLALAREALADPAGAPLRVAALERLTRIAAPAAASPAPAAPASRASPNRAPAVEPNRATPSRSAAMKRQPARSRPAARSRCDTATAAGRALCTSPALQRADREMLRAYDRALAAGIDEHLLNRQQARWRRAVNVAGGDREALARLYERRIWELNADARARE